MTDKPTFDIEALAQGLHRGDRRALARAITLVESTRDDHRRQAEALLGRLAPRSERGLRIGISGTPGVGKSTFIETLGLHILKDWDRLAILTVDPSSALAGGSILGDKTRMARLATRDDVFIRPSPSGATFGGVARHSADVIALCEAAGFDCVIVETVGVGQSETTVSLLTDIFLLLLAPASGDELQGIKRGIVEMADMIVVNKADGELVNAANQVAAEYANAVQLRASAQRHRVDVLVCSALEDVGVEDIWQALMLRFKQASATGELHEKRLASAGRRIWDEALAQLASTIRSDAKLTAELARLQREVGAGKLPVSLAARQLVNTLLSQE